MIIMRHGECYLDYPNDPSLTKYGIKVVKNIAEHISYNYTIDKVLCSPKKRAIETAKLILETNKADLLICKILKEVSKEISLSEQDRIIKSANEFILPNINNNSTILVGHMNFLNKLFSLYFNTKTNYFEDYSNIVIVTHYNEEYQIKKLF